MSNNYFRIPSGQEQVEGTSIQGYICGKCNLGMLWVKRSRMGDFDTVLIARCDNCGKEYSEGQLRDGQAKTEPSVRKPSPKPRRRIVRIPKAPQPVFASSSFSTVFSNLHSKLYRIQEILSCTGMISTVFCANYNNDVGKALTTLDTCLEEVEKSKAVTKQQQEVYEMHIRVYKNLLNAILNDAALALDKNVMERISPTFEAAYNAVDKDLTGKVGKYYKGRILRRIKPGTGEHTLLIDVNPSSSVLHAYIAFDASKVKGESKTALNHLLRVLRNLITKENIDRSKLHLVEIIETIKETYV